MAKGSAGDSVTGSEEGSSSDQLEGERNVVLTAKGLDDGPNSRQLRYSSAEGNGVQDDSTLSRAQRRRRAKQNARVDSAAADKTSDKPEGAPVAENRGPRRGRRRKG